VATSARSSSSTVRTPPASGCAAILRPTPPTSPTSVAESLTSSTKSGAYGASRDAVERDHMWSIITWKSHLSPRRITLRPRWHPPSPVKGPSIGNPPTFIGGARCTFVTWPNTEQDRRQCSSKDPAVKPLAGSHRNGHRPPGKRSSSAGLLSGRLVFYTVLRLPASDWTKR
jgi:hypothetical protein